MIEPGLGRLALWLAVAAGLGAAVAGLAGRHLGSRLLVVAAVCAGVATAVLGSALLDNDFSWAYVADNSRRHASAPYRLAALWGGMAGSLLVFATLLAVAGCVAAWRAERFGTRTAALMAGMTGGLVAALGGLVLAFADPFERLDMPAIEGLGLTPILEHPAMLYHPPLLYLGLVSLAPPAALTLAATFSGGAHTDDWAATVRRWLVVPWTLLAIGMVAGAHWAYVELGWGGFWAWDPVENTALLPWLAVTLALHALVPGALGRWRHAAAALVCLAFVLALGGTMLTRSGAVPSVHAFGEDRAVGRGLAVLLAVVTVGAAGVLWRGRTALVAGHHSPGGGAVAASVGAAANVDMVSTSPSAPGESQPSVHRGGIAASVATKLRPRTSLLVLLVVGHLVVVGGVLVVTTIGTGAPLVRELVGGDDVAIEGRYFAGFVGPLAAIGLALLVLVPAVRSSLGRAWPALPVGAAAIGGVGAIGLLALGGGEMRVGSLVLATAAGAALGSAVLGAATDGVRGVGAHVAHGGLALLLLGVAGTTTGTTVTVPVQAGQTVDVGGEAVRFERIEATEDGAGRPAVTAVVEVAGRTLHPSLVAYEDRGELLAETSLISGLARDIQVGLRRAAVDDGQTNADAVATLQIGVYPLQVLVWWAALIIITGGAVMLLPRRLRRR